MTPSAAHNGAYQRDRGHDAMQMAFLKFLRTRPLSCLPASPLVHHQVEGELALSRRGQVVAFVDCAETITVGLSQSVNWYEIKPRIETVFGVVRQAKALEQLGHSLGYAKGPFAVHVVVPASDPKITDLKAEWPNVWAWEQ